MIVWSGRPQQGFVVRSSDAVLIFLSAAWFIGVASWTWEVFSLGAPLNFKITGAVGTLIGAYLLFARFVVDAHFRGQSYYALTTKRVLVIGGFTGRNVATFNYPQKEQVLLIPAGSDRATVRFGPASPVITWHATYWRNPEFFRVLDGAAVAEQLKTVATAR